MNVGKSTVDATKFAMKNYTVYVETGNKTEKNTEYEEIDYHQKLNADLGGFWGYVANNAIKNTDKFILGGFLTTKYKNQEATAYVSGLLKKVESFPYVGAGRTSVLTSSLTSLGDRLKEFNSKGDMYDTDSYKGYNDEKTAKKMSYYAGKARKKGTMADELAVLTGGKSLTEMGKDKEHYAVSRQKGDVQDYKFGEHFSSTKIVSGGLWKGDIDDSVVDFGKASTSINLGDNGKIGAYATGGLLHYEVGDGYAQFDLLHLEAGTSLEYQEGAHKIAASGHVELDIGHARAEANAEVGWGYAKVSASVEASVVHFEQDASASYKIDLGTGRDLTIVDAGVSGQADVLHASAEATVGVGIYKDDDGKLHYDCGAHLEAEADLWSASGTAHVNVLGMDASVTGGVKLGVGAKADVGFVDGKLNCNVGIAVGIGFELGFSVDVSGVIENGKAIVEWAANTLEDVGNLFEGAAEAVGEFFDDPIGAIGSWFGWT